jgi:hypothetical protein
MNQSRRLRRRCSPTPAPRGGYGAAPPASRVANALAARRACGPPLTPEPLRPLTRKRCGQGGALPATLRGAQHQQSRSNPYKSSLYGFRGLPVERQRQIAAHERREREDAIALEAYKQQALADRLLADLNAWELAGRLRAYVTMLSERVETMNDDGERSAAIEWLEWCETYLAEHDPATKAITMPGTVKWPVQHRVIVATVTNWIGV